jgi:hypothetical protein
LSKKALFVSGNSAIVEEVILVMNNVGKGANGRINSKKPAVLQAEDC